MIENYGAWDLNEAVQYYETLRNKPGDIYESERVFFFPLMKNSRSVLDLGCAAGGTYNIIKTVNPDILYTGIDVSRGMVESAMKIFPGVDFRLSSGNTLDFPDNSFDVVIALGVLNHVPDYRMLIRECYRVARRFCLLDLPRLVPEEHQFDINKTYMILRDRFKSNKGLAGTETKVPYVLADAGEVFGFLIEELQPGSIYAKGYFGHCDKSVTIPYDQVCFTVVCIEKGNGGKSDIVIDLPNEIRQRLAEKNIRYTEPFEWILGKSC
ncbi:MAG: class I SAM-dependent methyltransferase [Nitrospirae bacterium]|nr:class I SAM-dependent methyltransferase [Nitrospirota bacterium]